MSSAAASSRPLTDELDELNKLNSLLKKVHFSVLHFFFIMIGLSEQDIEGVSNLLIIKNALTAKKEFKERAIPILQYCLELIRVGTSESLCCSKEELEACKTEFSYASVLVQVCMDLSKDQIDELSKYFSTKVLKIADDRCKSCADLFLRLHRGKHISPNNLGLLTKQLRAIDREDICEYLQYYINYGIFNPELCSSSTSSLGLQIQATGR